MGKRPSSESHHISFLCIIPSRTALNLYFYFLTLLNPRLNFYRMTIILGLPSVFSRWNSSYTFWCEYHRNKVSSYRWCLRSLASLLHCKLLFFFPFQLIFWRESHSGYGNIPFSHQILTQWYFRAELITATLWPSDFLTPSVLLSWQSSVRKILHSLHLLLMLLFTMGRS